MKKKKNASPLAVACITTFFTILSSFTNRGTTYYFVRVYGSARTRADINYVYNPSGICVASTTTTCLAAWSQNTSPRTGSYPNITASFRGTVDDGNFISF